ncbi:hypothetical protein Droror1_Dr00015154 [Drosera rotundifolia]
MALSDHPQMGRGIAAMGTAEARPERERRRRRRRRRKRRKKRKEKLILRAGEKEKRWLRRGDVARSPASGLF